MSDAETITTGPEALARVRALVEDLETAIVTTADAQGTFVGRPLVTRLMDDAGDLWFFTVEAEALGGDRAVTLSYLDAKARRYVSISGSAAVVDDPARAHELYVDDLDTWFENGLATPGISLLRVTPRRCEFWEPSQSRLASAARAIVGASAPEGPAVRHGVFER